MRITFLLALTSVAILSAGCGVFIPPPESQQTTSAPADEPAAAAENATDSAVEPPGEVDTVPEIPSEPVAPPVDPPTSELPTDPIRSPTETVEAEAGVGVKGQSLEPGSIITEPARAFFRVEQRLTFTQVEQALQLYKATNGSFPADTDEFMEKIVQANNLKLPELPQGHVYVFDAESGKLMVQRPRN